MEEPAITAGFLRFLAGEARKADALYILGDLFEAWKMCIRDRVYVEGAWNRVTNKKGNTSLYDHNDNTSDYSKNGAGIENYRCV